MQMKIKKTKTLKTNIYFGVKNRVSGEIAAMNTYNELSHSQQQQQQKYSKMEQKQHKSYNNNNKNPQNLKKNQSLKMFYF